MDEAGASRAGGEAVLGKLSEVLFIETLRAYIADLPPDQTGWLAGARDAEIGKTLALMHRSPAQPWTIASLAKEAGISRSVLAQRFRHYLSSLRWPSSRAGDSSWGRRCWLQPVIRSRRLHQKLATNLKRPSIAHLSENPRQPTSPVFATSRDPLAKLNLKKKSRLISSLKIESVPPV